MIETCRKHGKHCGVGGLASRPDLIAEYVRMGARYVSSGTDLALSAQRCDAAGEAGQGHQALMAELKAPADRVYASALAADAFARSVLSANGVPDEHAATVARCLVHADLRGVDTHGLCRLPIYLDRLRNGLINPRPALEPKRVTPVAATLDGENGFGFVIGLRAMEEAIAMAREYGIGVVSVKRSTHFGMAASYALPAVEAGMMAMVFSNASPAMPPWGGKSMLLGTNPFCMAAPAGKHRPIILDMSPAVAARGKIRRAERRGETIPLGYALDADGQADHRPEGRARRRRGAADRRAEGLRPLHVHGHFRRRDLRREFRRRCWRSVQGL